MPSDAWRMQPTVAPMMIGNYEVMRRIATGGMGEVYLAAQTGPVDFRRNVVLKKLHPRFAADPRFVAMFLNEARIAANLAHANIVHIYELIEDGESYAIAMEYVRGGTVLELLRGLEAAELGRMPYGAMIRIAASVCDALYYAYNEPDADGVPRRVIHRDVSPSNVLVGYDGQVKLADFGIAKALEDDDGSQSTTIKGKYGYLTPEQIQCKPLDQRSDLFSLGTMLWEMSVGKRLFQRDTDMQMLFAIAEDDIPRPSQHIADYPEDLERVVMKALARNPADRYADANELAADLLAVARRNEWDCEKPAVARLVKDVLPDDQIAFGRMGSDAFASSSGLRRRDGATGSWVDVESFESIVVIEPVRPVGAAGSRAALLRDWWTRSTLITTAVMLVLSAVFWIWIVPAIAP